MCFDGGINVLCLSIDRHIESNNFFSDFHFVKYSILYILFMYYLYLSNTCKININICAIFSDKNNYLNKNYGI